MKRLATIVSTLLVGLALSVGCPGQSSGAAIGSQLSNAKARAHRVPQSLPTLGAYNVDWSNVIVAGVSSGADMATRAAKRSAALFHAASSPDCGAIQRRGVVELAGRDPARQAGTARRGIHFRVGRNVQCGRVLDAHRRCSQ